MSDIYSALYIMFVYIDEEHKYLQPPSVFIEYIKTTGAFLVDSDDLQFFALYILSHMIYSHYLTFKEEYISQGHERYLC